jgi:hypothetical protein
LFGASAEEAVALRVALIDRRIEQRLDRLADALAQDEDTQQGEGIEEAHQTHQEQQGAQIGREEGE